MCGIIGIVDPDREISLAAPQAMLDSIVHRGPDDWGMWRSKCGAVTLGSRRLAILDLSPSGHMPMVSEDANCVIAYNGEIYNYSEIATELEAKGHRLHSSGDTEVLLKAYREWGEACLDRLNGMFAFAIWDESRKTLFAARDRFGEKPFYYYRRPGGQQLLFASEIKALFSSGQVEPEANNGAIYRFLVFGDIDADQETLFRGVMALPAAHALRYNPGTGQCMIWRYWDLEPDKASPVGSDRECAEHFLELFSDSVRLRLRADVAVGSSLSGGLDSSSIVCAIAREGHGRQATFSARFTGHDKFDEGPYIQAVCEHTGLPNHGVVPDAERYPEEAEQVAWQQDHPFLTSSVYAQWNVMRLAAEHNVTVLLDGQGADEILAGYDDYLGPLLRQLLRTRRLVQGSRELRRYIEFRGWKFLPNVLATFLPAGIRGSAARSLRTAGVRAEFSRQWSQNRPSAERRFKDPFRQELYQTLTRSILPKLLRYADRNSLAFSREVRLPFLDHRLVEWLFSLPPDQLLRDGERKFILRRGLGELLPEKIRNRKDKLGFAPPQDSWLRGPLRNWASDILLSDRMARREWADGAGIRSVYTEFSKGNKGSAHLWRWISLELWARMFLDGRWRAMAPVSRKREAYETTPAGPEPVENSLYVSNPAIEGARAS